MSGRKRSEVLAVLKSSADIRKARIDRELSELDSALSELTNYADDSCRIEKFTEELHEDQQANLTRQLAAIHSEAMQKKADFETQVSAVRQSSQELINRTRLLEDKLNTRKDYDHYDREYADATEIKTAYERQVSQLASLQKNLRQALGELATSHVDLFSSSKTQVKRNAEAELNEFLNLQKSMMFRHPVNGKLLHFKEFFCLAGDGEAVFQQVIFSVDNARQAIHSENYKMFRTQFNQAKLQWKTLCERLTVMEELLGNQVTTACAIRDALKDSGSTVEVIIDDKLVNGIRVRTVETASPVEFTVTQEIDHESKAKTQVLFNIDNWGNDCTHNAQHLQQLLKQRGVFVSHGKTIANADSTQNTSKKHTTKVEQPNNRTQKGCE